MLTKLLVTAATSAPRQEMPTGAARVRHVGPTIGFDGISVPTVGGCALASGFTSAAVDSNDIPGSPPWSPPV